MNRIQWLKLAWLAVVAALRPARLDLVLVLQVCGQLGADCLHALRVTSSVGAWHTLWDDSALCFIRCTKTGVAQLVQIFPRIKE